MSDRHVFGNDNQWAMDTDDGCIRFYPQHSINPEIRATWIWKEALQEVEKLGGAEKAIEYLRGLSDHTPKE